MNSIEEIKNHYISQMKISGVFSKDIQNSIEDELESMGLTDTEITATDGYENNISSEDIIFRNSEDVKSSIIYLHIKAKPRLEPFIFGKLLGETNDEEFFFYVKGRTVSERPNY